MELFASRRRFVGLPANKTHHIAKVRVSAGTYEYRNLGPALWAREAFRQARTDHIVVFVHGYNNSHAEVMKRFGMIRRGLQRAKFTGEVVTFEWPSLDRLTAYPDDLKLAKAAAPFLVEDVLRVLWKHKPSAKISFVVHSMGSLLLAEALHRNPISAGAINEILFVASDVARRDMRRNEDYADALAKAGHRLTNYRSMRDQVLDLSQKVYNGGKRRAGKDGVDELAHSDVCNVSCSLRYFTFVEPRDRTTAKSHNFYFDDPLFYQDAALTLAGKDAATMPTRSRRPNGELQLKP